MKLILSMLLGLMITSNVTMASEDNLYTAETAPFLKWVKIKQNEDSFYIFRRGSDFFSWYIAKDKSVLLYNYSTDLLEFSKIENGNLSSTGVVYKKGKRKSFWAKGTLKTVEQGQKKKKISFE